MTGVVLGTLLLVLLIALVILQGMIEWGGFDFDKIFKKKETEPLVKEKVPSKTKTKAKAKPAKKAAKKKAAKKKGKGKK